jgi:hypothetical protein
LGAASGWADGVDDCGLQPAKTSNKATKGMTNDEWQMDGARPLGRFNVRKRATKTIDLQTGNTEAA